MSDFIRRQDVIDYIKAQRGRPFIGITLEEAIIMMIEEVPSAQPDSQPTCNNLATDTISRQTAIDAVNKIAPVNTEYDCTLLDILDVRYVLTELPSAEGCKCPCEYREPCDYCPYHRHGCPAEEGLKDE